MWVAKCNNAEVGKMRVRRRDARIWFILLGILTMVFLFTFLTVYFKDKKMGAEAVSLDEFDPGYIISDWQMGRYDAMSEAEIQAFLTMKNSCGNQNYDYYLRLSANTNYKWHFDNGHFVCLSEELFGDGEVIGEGETAAHIIWQTAQDYQINPQVLLVLLQKETGLITDPIPNDKDYRKATGYGCPDTAPCSAQYYGFKNQVRKAAALFRTVLNGGWTNYPLGDNYIQYNPSSECGGSVVNIRSLATSALYRYTPYQPNEGALAAGYGTAYCGAYGNRNFYLYFEDWFGGIKEEGVVIKDNFVEIEEGFYVFHSALDNNKVIDIDGGVATAKSGTNIQLYEDNGTDAQIWRAIKNDDGTYTFINTQTARVLDVANGSLSSGANIQLYIPNGTLAQKWKINYNDDGTYTLVTASANLAIDVNNGESVNGANIQIYARNGTEAQKWTFVKIEELQKTEKRAREDNNTYVIESALNGSMVIDVSGGGAKDGTNIQLFSRNNTDAQKWKLVVNEDETYTIMNVGTGKVLDVANGLMESGGNVQLYTQNKTCAQKWLLEKDEAGKVLIRSACSDLAIDVANGEDKNGANIQVYAVNSTLAQKWEIKRVAEEILPDALLIFHSALDNNKVIDIDGGVATAKSGTNIQLYEDNGTDAQIWRAIKNDDGTYTFINTQTARVLDVANGSLSSGANIQLYIPNGTLAQKWKINYNDDGTYTLVTASANLAIDVNNGESVNGANIQIYALGNSAAQKWMIETIR